MQTISPTTAALVLGTGNRKKAAELAELLAPLGLAWQSLADFAESLAIEEDGHSFAGNAERKATRQAEHLNGWVLGDDSGLVVDALDGAPGIYSARFAGPGATDQLNRERLLAELENVPLERRTAHFVCHLALADPSGICEPKRPAAVTGGFASSPRAPAGSVTTRCSKSSNITAPSAS
jgi:XTP/dITP diphosphohydrolase